MKVKISEIVKLKMVYEKINQQTVSIKTAYKICKFFTKVEEEYNFYDKELNKILDKYAEKNEDGNYKTNNNGVQIKPEFIKTAKDQLESLMNLEVDFIDIKFTLDELDTIQLSIEEINALIPFIEE